MSRIQDPHRFPKQYLDLAEEFEQGTTEVVLEFESEHAAKDFRQDFYAFRTSAEKAGLTGFPPAGTDSVLYPRLNNLMLKFLPPDKMLFDDLKLHRQTEKYVQQNFSQTLPETRRRILVE